jgi:hypothetical protein
MVTKFVFLEHLQWPEKMCTSLAETVVTSRSRRRSANLRAG